MRDTRKNQSPAMFIEPLKMCSIIYSFRPYQPILVDEILELFGSDLIPIIWIENKTRVPHKPRNAMYMVTAITA